MAPPAHYTPEFDAEPNKSFISNKTIPAGEPNEPNGNPPNEGRSTAVITEIPNEPNSPPN